MDATHEHVSIDEHYERCRTSHMRLVRNFNYTRARILENRELSTNQRNLLLDLMDNIALNATDMLKHFAAAVGNKIH